jgi:hypothetical protein
MATDTRTPADRLNTAAVRAWATGNGWDVPERGRIPKGVVAAYRAAHTDSEPGEDGPDWDAAGEAAGDDPLAALEADLEDQAAVVPADQEGPPPPASLEEARTRFKGKAKRPSWASSREPKAKSPAPKLTKAVVGDIEGKLTLLLTGPAMFWSMADPLCGGAFADNLDSIVRKAVPLICQSPEAVRWFTKGTTFLLWLDLVWALQPVAQAVHAHHVAGSVMLVDGRAVASRRLDDGRVVPADQAPPQPHVDNSAYSTATVTGHVPDVRPA